MEPKKSCPICSGLNFLKTNYSQKYRELVGFKGDTKKWHVHHIDGNRNNNCCSNLVLLDSRLHGQYHYALNAVNCLNRIDIESQERMIDNRQRFFVQEFLNGDCTAYEMASNILEIERFRHMNSYEQRQANKKIKALNEYEAAIASLKKAQIRLYSPSKSLIQCQF